MYLLGYSLNNLTLMALTISTGFVVDDAIVMIENITRYIEDGEESAGGGAERVGADRLHHRFADDFADCGADPAAVHGRHRGPSVPRIRRHAERHDPGVGGGFADADADDVLEAAEAHARGRAGPLLSALRSAPSRRSSTSTAGRCKWVLGWQVATLLVAVGDAGA